MIKGLLAACLLLFSLLVCSCSESKMLCQSLTSYPQPLGYELVSPIDSSVKTDSLIVAFSGFPMDSLTTVKRVKGLVLPFIFLNVAEYKYRFLLGTNLLKSDYNDFFFQALLDESNRSGRYALCYDSTRLKDVYKLEVSLDSCQTETHLEESTLMVFYVYGYFTSYTESSYPARSNLRCRLRLSKADRLLRDTTVSVSKMLVFAEGDQLSREERMQRTASCMAETLCQATRDCVASLVEQVNAALKNDSSSQANH